MWVPNSSGWGCPTRSSVTPPSRGTRCGLSTTPQVRGGSGKGLGIIEAHPDQAYLNYNVARCESLVGRTADAIEHLLQAIDMCEGCRDMAKEDSDFDPIRDEPPFEELIGR
jgi:hypothetical protein